MEKKVGVYTIDQVFNSRVALLGLLRKISGANPGVSYFEIFRKLMSYYPVCKTVQDVQQKFSILSVSLKIII